MASFLNRDRGCFLAVVRDRTRQRWVRAFPHLPRTLLGRNDSVGKQVAAKQTPPPAEESSGVGRYEAHNERTTKDLLGQIEQERRIRSKRLGQVSSL